MSERTPIWRGGTLPPWGKGPGGWKLPQEILEVFFRDPVMAAEVMFGVSLKPAQRARLRYYWFVPEVIDSSGIGSGKTFTDFLYMALRCILIPAQEAVVYFPTLAAGSDKFIQYFRFHRDNNPFFQQQLILHRGRYGERKENNIVSYHYKNGSVCKIPALSATRDGLTQASGDFNTVLCEEWTQTETLGNAIDKQIVTRLRSDMWAPGHPVWCNHIKFVAHAEYPLHPAYPRYKGFKAAIAESDQTKATFSINFEDLPEAFVRKHGTHKIAATQKKIISRDAYRRQFLGIWSADGSGYYPETTLETTYHPIVPLLQRADARDVYFLGIDTAPPSSGRDPDYCSFTMYRTREVDPVAESWTYMSEDGKCWDERFVFSYSVRRWKCRRISGFIHSIFRWFGFALAGMDLGAGGGGALVMGDLEETTQSIFENWGEEPHEEQVVPLTPRMNATREGHPIVCGFRQGGDYDKLWIPAYRAAPEGVVACAHMFFKSGWDNRQFHYPTPTRLRAGLSAMTAHERDVLKHLDLVLEQLPNVRVKTHPDGTARTSQKGFVLFESNMKKDSAYSALYAFNLSRLWHLERMGQSEEEGSTFG